MKTTYGPYTGKTLPEIETEVNPVYQINYKYNEDLIMDNLQQYLDSTYGAHYVADDNIQCFDAWIAMGDSTATFRNTAMKYLWRYGKKNGNNKADLMKALHYIILCLYVDHYKDMDY